MLSASLNKNISFPPSFLPSFLPNNDTIKPMPLINTSVTCTDCRTHVDVHAYFVEVGGAADPVALAAAVAGRLVLLAVEELERDVLLGHGVVHVVAVHERRLAAEDVRVESVLAVRALAQPLHVRTRRRFHCRL